MTIALANGSHGGFFDAAGYVGGVLNDINALRGGSATSNVLSAANMATRVATMETYWAATTDRRKRLDGIFAQLASFQSNQGSWLTQLQSIVVETLKQMANDDVPLAAYDLSNALDLLIAQMTGVASVNASAVTAGAQTAVGSPTGNPIIVASTTDPNGLALQYTLPETLTVKCTRDSYTGGATAGQETMSVVGQAAVTNALDYTWPGGSGVGTSLTCVDATLDNSGGNLLKNSGFEAFTSNTPDNWTNITGTPGSAGGITNPSGTAYTGSNSLEILGDGSTLTALKQVMNVSSNGTAGRLLPATAYALNCWIKMSATPSTGVLKFDLVDGSNTILNDVQGTANTITKSLTAVSSTYINVNGFFRTPALLPASGYALRIRVSTAIENGKNLFIDHLALTPLVSIYNGGPLMAVFSSATKLLLNDAWTIAMGNTWGLFQQLLLRLLGLNSLGANNQQGQWCGKVIPNSGSPSISDSLIA